MFDLLGGGVTTRMTCVAVGQLELNDPVRSMSLSSIRTEAGRTLGSISKELGPIGKDLLILDPSLGLVDVEGRRSLPPSPEPRSTEPGERPSGTPVDPSSLRKAMTCTPSCQARVLILKSWFTTRAPNARASEMKTARTAPSDHEKVPPKVDKGLAERGSESPLKPAHVAV